MPKVMEFTVICPDCGLKQAYHSYNKTVDGKRRKECNKCGRSFKVKEQRLGRLPDVQKKLRKEKERKGEGFHKYTKKDSE